MYSLADGRKQHVSDEQACCNDDRNADDFPDFPEGLGAFPSVDIFGGFIFVTIIYIKIPSFIRAGLSASAPSGCTAAVGGIIGQGFLPRISVKKHHGKEFLRIIL